MRREAQNAFIYADNSKKQPKLMLHQFPTQSFPPLQCTQQFLLYNHAVQPDPEAVLGFDVTELKVTEKLLP